MKTIKKNNEDNDNYQKQQLISKQRVIQAQELVLLINNFGRALTSLEYYANRYQDFYELQKKDFYKLKFLI